MTGSPPDDAGNAASVPSSNANSTDPGSSVGDLASLSVPHGDDDDPLVLTEKKLRTAIEIAKLASSKQAFGGIGVASPAMVPFPLGGGIAGAQPRWPSIQATQRVLPCIPRRGYHIRNRVTSIEVTVLLDDMAYSGVLSEGDRIDEFVTQLMNSMPAHGSDLATKLTMALHTSMQADRALREAVRIPGYLPVPLFVSGWLSRAAIVAKVDISPPLTSQQSHAVLMLAARLVQGNTLCYAIENGLADRLERITVDQDWSE